MKTTEIKKNVRENYANVVKSAGQSSCCDVNQAGLSSCCAGSNRAQAISKQIGYSEEEINSVPEGANLGLGCGNPTALASLKKGETVLDLGSGAGFDCFLAVKKVGKTGKVIGVDMTPEMIDKARENARNGKYQNVEFRLGEIENLPAADNSVDVIISNCVINLAPDKSRVFSEAFRVLKPGGRMMISDMVLLKDLPGFILESISAYVGCISGAMKKDAYLNTISGAGFNEVKMVSETIFPIDCMANDPTAQALIKQSGITPETLKELADSVASIKVLGTKPVK
jgi:arsenite methyltransferase